MAEDDEADRVYQAALALIEDVRKAGGTLISFDAPEFRALTRIPPEIAGIAGLASVDLDRTQVSDTAPLAPLTGLTVLSLSNTPVSDTAPLAALTGLTRLSLSKTQVSDIAPLAALKALTTLNLSRTPVRDTAPLAAMTGLTMLDLSNTQVSDTAPLAALTGLRTLILSNTQVSDTAPLAALTGLRTLFLSNTPVSDTAPLATLTGLTTLYLSNTQVSDTAPLAAMTGLTTLYLSNTQVSDLRPIATLPLDTKGPFNGLWFVGTPATEKDPELARLAAIEDDHERTAQTLAYLKTLPPWPSPLPWLEPPPPPVPDAGVPLRVGENGITLGTRPISAAEQDDPIRATLHAVLQDQTADLIRVAGNIDEVAFRQATVLRDLLEPGLAAMDALRVHLAIEALRRIRGKADPTADRDYLLALDAVIETGPGLTLDTEQVQLFVDRARRNRLDRLEEAEAETQIRLALSIAESPLSAPDIKAIAERAADDRIRDQFTAIRPTLGRNYVLEVARWTTVAAASGIVGNSAHVVWVANDAWTWLAANAADLRVLARIWGEPFAAWLVPILDRAPLMIEGAKSVGRKPKGDA